MNETRYPGRSSLRRRLLLWLSIVLVALVVVIGLLVQGGVRDLLVERLAEDLEDKARVVSLTVGEADVEAIGKALEMRVTLIDVDGTVIADSEADPSIMDDHSDRPEVIAATTGEVGVSRRFSATTDEARMYVALPPDDGIVVRLSVTEQRIDDELQVLSARLLPILVLVLVGGLVLVFFVSRALVRPFTELADVARSVASGRLEVRARRSSIEELDELGLAIGHMASELGRRILETETERQTMEAVLGALPQGVVLVEDDDAISYANPEAVRMLGEIPQRLSQLVPTPLQRLVRDVRSSEEPSTVALEVGVPARRIRSVASPFPGDDGRILVALEDITDRHRIESIRRDFVADASHELKTPVASILASTETLRMALDRDPDRAADFASQVEASARRLARIVEDLLDLSRLESSEEVRSHLDLADVVRDEVDRLRGKAADSGVTLEANLSPAPIVGSGSDLALAVRNLIENAIRYTDAGGSVTLTLERIGDELMLAVADTGTGIPSRALPRVFERFYRVDVARSRETGGTGLGLAIVRHVAERHGGSVSVESELGVGSTFRINLPSASESP